MKRNASRAPGATGWLPQLLLLFVGSGCAALIYEVVWLQLLALVIGSSAASLGVLLGTFMGGLCAGSLLIPRYLATTRHPLVVFAVLELSVAAFALALLTAMPLVNDLYAVGSGRVAVRIAVAAACLLPPTIAMGATLPAIARWVRMTTAGVSWLGWLYAGNLAGAVIGSVFAGFYLLRAFDMAIATYVAAAINVGVASVALAIAARTSALTGSDPGARAASDRAPAGSWSVYVAIALSGLTALSCEVVWTRLLSLVFGATVYAFSLILAAFLFGLGAGSSLGAVVVRRGRSPRAAFGVCQLLLCVAMAWAAYLLANTLPYWPVADIVRSDPWRTFQLDLIRSLVVVFPAAVLWGASLPLALAAVAAPGRDPGRLVGGLYAANTAGAIAGALGTSLFVLGRFGTQTAEQALIVTSAASAFVVLAAGEPRRGRGRLVGLAAAASAAALLVLSVPAVPGLLVAYGRRAAEWAGLTTIVDVEEGRHTFVAVSRGSNGVLNYHADGKVQASVQAEDMRLQRLLGHVSHLWPKRPASVLVIGCGAGITAGALSIGPGVERLTIAEIEPAAARVAAAFFADYNYRVIDNPKVSLRFDDGRHVLLTSREKFDVITTDLVDPWVKGVATLFTKEFFEAAKRHLNPGGVVTQFVQLYQSSTEAVKSEIGTFIDVFPNTIVWANMNNGQGYDLVLLGQNEPIQIDVDALQAKLDDPRYAEVAQSLREIGFSSAVSLLSTYVGSASDLAPWLKDAMINRDRNLRLQYLAGLGFNLDESGPIYLEMLQYSKFPEHLFVGSSASVQAVRDGMRRANAR